METIEQRTPEWFEQRKGRITASAVGAILGIAPYQTRDDVMRRMVREYHGYESEFKGNAATEWGTYHEAGAIKEFEMETGLTVTPAPFIPYGVRFGASPDGFVSDDSIIEVKCPYGLKKGGEFKSIDNQMHYYAQIQLQLLVTDKTLCHFFQWNPHGTKHEIVNRDDAYIVEMLDNLIQFYGEYEAERELPHAEKYLDIYESKPELTTLMREYQALKRNKEYIDERMKAVLEGMVLMTDERGGEIDGHKLFKTTKQGSISYAKAVKDLLPDANLEPYRGEKSTYWSIK